MHEMDEKPCGSRMDEPVGYYVLIRTTQDGRHEDQRERLAAVAQRAIQ